MTLWWLSFVDPERPKGARFLGAALIEGRTLPEVLTKSWATGCNPGGEVQAVKIPLDYVDDVRLDAFERAERNVLMDPAAIDAAGLGPARRI